MNANAWLAALGVVGVLASADATAGSYCENQYGDSITKATNAYAPTLESLRAEIKRVQDAGLDPTKYVTEFEGQYVPLTYKFAVLVTRYKTEANRARGEAQGCASAVAPAQTAVDIATTVGTGGLSLVLPYQVTHIDVGEILHGKPLGGDSALVPKAREDILRAITGHDNDQGEISKIIRDPIKCTVGHLFGQCN
jgi:hypothetical protein